LFAVNGGKGAGVLMVISLGDVHGWTGREVCAALGLTKANQRVLLHRARAKVQRASTWYLDSGYSP
jgi:RNA polymerase sigma-70 factor, ECF subfamily